MTNRMTNSVTNGAAAVRLYKLLNPSPQSLS